MQSGSDAVLRRMRRRWGSQRFIDRCRLVQERLDRPAITTDIIVGFPGETDAEFRGNVRRARERRLLEDSHLPVQPAPRHAGRRDAEPSAEARAARAVARTGGRRSRAARRSTTAACSGGGCACWWRATGAAKRQLDSARPAATRRSSCRPPQRTKAASSMSSPATFAATASSPAEFRPVVRPFCARRYNRAFAFCSGIMVSSRRIEKWLFELPSTGSAASVG